MAMKETKELIQFIVAMGNALGASLEDGKLGLSDLWTLANAAKNAESALQNLSAVPSEFSTMSAADKAELIALVETLEIPQENIEEVAEKILKSAVVLGEVVAMFLKRPVQLPQS